jgi:DNA-binding MarR family transcriptional regulator
METTGGRLVPVLAQLVRLLRELEPRDQLSLVTLSVLGRLHREGARRLTDLARAERATQPAMSQLVDRMARDGLVRRIASVDDGRVTLVELLPAGGAAYDDQLRLLGELLDARLSGVPAGDRALVDAALPVLDALCRRGAEVAS